ncbi:SDR family oxidoreductase [Achromobacter insolitus]|uniref:SDR family oxidoreductase n=1 Tax=Achromobacter insolitus TaxID=217204 RepID=UPI003455FAE6
MNPWLTALREGAVSGSTAGVLSTLVLALAGRRQAASWSAPTNSTSHWIWGPPALHADAPSWRHTVTGYAIHHSASVFWGVLHARSTLAMPATHRPSPAVAAGLAAAAVACLVDYRATPQRLTPGFEHRLSTMALVLVYGAFGLGMALGSLAWRARERRRAGEANIAAFGGHSRNGDCWPFPQRDFRVANREHSMKLKLKPLREQVMVITGASSGIGAATARMAAERGAKVVLVGRQEDALNDVLNDIVRAGGSAVSVAADVGVQDDHDRILQRALQSYGRVDTWVNNAGVSIFGKLESVPIEDQRKLFDTDYWGVVYGSMVAVRYMKTSGGALINVGSEVSDRAVPLQGAYSAAKHAVKGFTDALRMELREEDAPVSVTLIKPASIATGFTSHARNYMDVQPSLPPPVYAPEAVADAILHAAEHPTRDLYVGSASRAISTLGQNMPSLADRMARWLFKQQRGRAAAGGGSDSLYEGGGSHPAEPQSGRRHSVYTKMAMHQPSTSLVTAAAVIGGAAYWLLRSRR